MNRDNSGILYMSFYFVLNLFVTVSSKHLNCHLQSAWLLTSSHAISTFVVTSLLSWVRNHTSTSKEPGTSVTNARVAREDKEVGYHDRNTHTLNFRGNLLAHPHILIPFGLLYTINIVMSNWTLGLVSLTMHQTIRATAPVITVTLPIIFLRKSWREYSLGVYGAVSVITCGVIWATNTAHTARSDTSPTISRTNLSGFAWTLSGAILAVAKTIFSSHLQRPPHKSKLGLGLSSTVLVRYCCLCAFALTILVASWNGDFGRMISPKNSTAPGTTGPWLWLWPINALASSMLNIASFEAVKRCGPLTMGVAGNLKQVVILLPYLSPAKVNGDYAPEAEKGVALGVLMTAIGGIWYALAKAEMDKIRRRHSIEEDN